ncbi:hypothetical protein Patl1_33099 [Pistacia atlantica]|uniref:Uncharacterized protein n=1 Tax=Pistacia atlantica TaxID=434234 RepID=A0ACC1ALW7_9ROSI|nr:hypothetical protein Patl1_33099 [Pistacia atlantica]
MIGGYAQSCSPVEAIVLFMEAMLSDEIDFDENGLDDEGLLLLYEMQKQQFMIDSLHQYRFASDFKSRNRDIGKQTHAYLLRHGIQFEGMESYLIDMYAKYGLIRASQQNFERNHTGDSGQATWNAMIAGYTQNGLVEEAFITFRQMLEQNVTPNVVNIASVLPACAAFVDTYSKSGSISYAENDQEHPQSDEIYETLEGLAMEMKNAGYRANRSSNLDAISQFNE